jgi:nicotinate-nucleotide adenylyltransferase
MALIGIFGGTFDPVHFGHLRMAEEVLNLTPMEQLRFVPSKHPPHREHPGASPEERVSLLKAALEGGDHRFRIDTRELKREGPSFMVDTLLSLREEVGRQTPMALIVGQDAAHGLPQWSRWLNLFDLAHLIILQRPGYPKTWPEGSASIFESRLAGDAEHLQSAPHGLILHLEVTQLEISASQIRTLTQKGQSTRYLLPERVIEEIRKKGLYLKP